MESKNHYRKWRVTNKLYRSAAFSSPHDQISSANTSIRQ
uniref:Uncharacterized protein n=1 Tax=Arundo donax TaxID=35708 RepID=A0A0A9FD46_ARUDO